MTTVCAMPNTKPVIDTKEKVEEVHRRAKEESLVHVIQLGSMTMGECGEELSDIEGMAQAGCYALSEDGKSVMNAFLFRKAMRKAKENDLLIFSHCEDISMVEGGVMNAGKRAEELGVKGITNSVEDVIVARDILIAKELDATLHLCHCSTADSVRMIKDAKEAGLKVTGEVCPHHFILTDEDIPENNGIWKMNPPLRSEADRQATIAAVADGTVDLLATDHAPHTMEEKELGFLDAPNGIIGLECAYGVCHKILVDGGFISDERLIELMSTGPAELMGHDKTDITAVLDDYADAVPGDDDTKRVLDLGRVPESDQVDLVVLNTGEEWTVDPEKFHSSARNTPFGGWQVTGRPARHHHRLEAGLQPHRQGGLMDRLIEAIERQAESKRRGTRPHRSAGAESGRGQLRRGNRRTGGGSDGSAGSPTVRRLLRIQPRHHRRSSRHRPGRQTADRHV